MTAVQMAEVFRNLSVIVEDEQLTKRFAKYLRKLIVEKESQASHSLKDV